MATVEFSAAQARRRCSTQRSGERGRVGGQGDPGCQRESRLLVLVCCVCGSAKQVLRRRCNDRMMAPQLLMT